jgi:photosystem II stability/assembly factor-like uncharacterized protein
MSSLRICFNRLGRPRNLARAIPFLLIAIALERMPAQANWSAVGPAGGDARAFAAVPGQPSHLYLGTLDSWIYESVDRGASWRRLAKLGSTDDLVLDNIVVDSSNPTTVYVAAWKLGQTGGGLWISRDGGKSWKDVEGLRGQ